MNHPKSNLGKEPSEAIGSSNRIPKIIHNVWYGRGDKSGLFVRCMRTWHEFHPDWQFIESTEDALGDYKSSTFIQSVISRKEFVKGTEFGRLLALYEHGGIYLDADVEVIRCLYPLLNSEFFIGYQDQHALNGAVFGCRPRSKVISALLENFPLHDQGFHKADTYGPLYITKVLTTLHFEPGELTTYPREFFYPYSYDQEASEAVITDNTYTIHHWAKSWW